MEVGVYFLAEVLVSKQGNINRILDNGPKVNHSVLFFISLSVQNVVKYIKLSAGYISSIYRAYLPFWGEGCR
jgi:hypothetical protein